PALLRHASRRVRWVLARPSVARPEARLRGAPLGQRGPGRSTGSLRGLRPLARRFSLEPRANGAPRVLEAAALGDAGRARAADGWAASPGAHGAEHAPRAVARAELGGATPA